MCYSARGLEVSMAVLTVVFEPDVPRAERVRLLNDLKNPAAPDDAETDAYGVQVPDATLWTWAHRYAELLFQGRPAISRVSYTRLRKDAESAP